MSCMTLLGEDSSKLSPGFLQTSSHMSFFFADLALCLFAVINHSHEYDYVPSPESSWRIIGPEVVLGIPETGSMTQCL